MVIIESGGVSKDGEMAMWSHKFKGKESVGEGRRLGIINVNRSQLESGGEPLAVPRFLWNEEDQIMKHSFSFYMHLWSFRPFQDVWCHPI